MTHEGNSLVALQDTALSDVSVGKADGSDAKQVTSGEAVGFGLTWIGDSLAAGTPRGKWFLMNSDGSSKASLTSDNDPQYWNVHNGQVELWSAAADGANAQKLVPATLIGSGICGPDSKSVLYVRDSAVWSVPIEGGTPEKTNFPFAQI